MLNQGSSYPPFRRLIFRVFLVIVLRCKGRVFAFPFGVGVVLGGCFFVWGCCFFVFCLFFWCFGGFCLFLWLVGWGLGGGLVFLGVGGGGLGFWGLGCGGFFLWGLWLLGGFFVFFFFFGGRGRGRLVFDTPHFVCTRSREVYRNSVVRCEDPTIPPMMRLYFFRSRSRRKALSLRSPSSERGRDKRGKAYPEIYFLPAKLSDAYFESPFKNVLPQSLFKPFRFVASRVTHS